MGIRPVFRGQRCIVGIGIEELPPTRTLMIDRKECGTDVQDAWKLVGGSWSLTKTGTWRLLTLVGNIAFAKHAATWWCFGRGCLRAT
jgi:hypothetical protein